MQNQKETLNKAQTYATTNIAMRRRGGHTGQCWPKRPANELVDKMAAQAKAFLSLRDQYERNPELFKRIRQMAALENVYTNAQEKSSCRPMRASCACS